MDLKEVVSAYYSIYEKKAAKDYDGDGKVESGTDEYMGSKDKAIKKAMGKKVGHNCSSKVKHEEYGIGDCVKEMHTLDEEGNITHYDVLFSGKVIRNIPVSHLDVIEEMYHEHVINDDKNKEIIEAKEKKKEKNCGCGKDPCITYGNQDEDAQEAIEFAADYFLEEGIDEEELDIIIEDVGLDDFVEFVYEERAARKARASAPSYANVKAAVDATDAAKKKAGKGEYSAAYKKKETDVTDYGDKPAKASVKKVKKSVAKAKVAKKDYDGDGKKESPTAEYKGSKDKAIKKAIAKKAPAKKAGLISKIGSAYKKGVERHKAARAKGKEPEKRVKEFGKGFASGVKDTVKFAGKVKKAVVGETLQALLDTLEEGESLDKYDTVLAYLIDEQLAEDFDAANKMMGRLKPELIDEVYEEQLKNFVLSECDEFDDELLQIVEDNLGVKTEDEILGLMESGWHRRNPGKKHPLESGSSKVTPRPVSDAEKKSTDKEDRMYVAMRRVKDRQKGYSKAKSDAADKLHGHYTSRQSDRKKGASPKEAAAGSHGDFGSKGFRIKRGGRSGKAPRTDRGTGNKAARRAGQEVKNRDPRKKS